MSLKIKKSDPIKVGVMTKTIISIKKRNSELTINDLTRIRNKILTEGNKKHKKCEIRITKVEAHQWLTYSNDLTKFNSYFDNLVLDKSKFNTFKEIQFYVYTQG